VTLEFLMTFTVTFACSRNLAQTLMYSSFVIMVTHLMYRKV